MRNTGISIIVVALLALAAPVSAAPVPGGTASNDQSGSKQGPVIGPVTPGAVWAESYDNYSGLEPYLLIDDQGHVFFQAERNDVTPRVPTLLALDRSDGSIAWVAEGIEVTCAPVVGDGVIFAQAQAEGPLAGAVDDSSDLLALSLEDGSVVGRHTPGADEELLACDDSLVLADDDTVVVTYKDFGINNPVVVQAFDTGPDPADADMRTIERRWIQTRTAPQNTDTLQRPYLSPDGDGVYVGYEIDPITLAVDRLDLEDGTADGTIELVGSEFALAGDGTAGPYSFVAGAGGFSLTHMEAAGTSHLTHVEDSGSALTEGWQLSQNPLDDEPTFEGGEARTLALGPDGRLMAVNGARHVTAIDHASGDIIWTYDTQRDIGFSRNQLVIDAAGNAIVPTNGGGLLLSVTNDGQLRYESRTPSEILGEDLDQRVTHVGPMDDTGTLYVAGSVAVDAQGVPPKPFVAAIRNVALRAGDEPDPIAAAISICRFLFGEDQARSVVLGRNDVFADVFTGAPLAGDHSCILFTESGTGTPLNDDTLAEIRRVLPDGGPVRIVGGPAAVSEDAADELADAGFEVSRLGGADRYQTAELIARAVVADTQATTAVLGFAGNWPDAVTAGAWAAFNGYPVLITDTDRLTPNIAETIADLGITDIRVAGGTAVVSDDAAGAADPDFVRYAGANRFLTATDVAANLWDDQAADQAFILANLEAELGWAYALAASPLSARLAAPQVGIANGRYPDETSDYLRSLGLSPAPGVIALGNINLIDDDVIRQVADDVGL